MPSTFRPSDNTACTSPPHAVALLARRLGGVSSADAAAYLRVPDDLAASADDVAPAAASPGYRSAVAGCLPDGSWQGTV